MLEVIKVRFYSYCHCNSLIDTIGGGKAMPLDTIRVAKLRTTGRMVPFDTDPDPFYDRMVVPPQLAPSFIVDSMMQVAKWQRRRLYMDDPAFRLVQDAVNALLLPIRQERALQDGPPPVARVAEPVEGKRLTIEVGLDLHDRFCVIDTLQPRDKVLAIITMHRTDRRIQSRTPGGH